LAELTECSEKEFQEWMTMKETIEAKHERIVEAMGRVFEEERKKNREEREIVLEDKEKDFREHHQKLREVERKTDDKIEAVKRRYESFLSHEKDEKIGLRGQAGIHKKHHEDLKRQMGYKEESLRNWLLQVQRRREKIEALVKDRAANIKEMEEREKTIEDKERRINDLRKQNQELEKFKFVLDYKIRELKGEIDPKSAEIAKMKTQITFMDAEIEECMRRNKTLSLEVSEMNMKQRALLGEIKEQKGKIDEEHREQEASRTAMRECYRDCKDPRKLRKNITAMYHELILEENKREKGSEGVEGESRTDAAEGDDVDAYQKEFNRQRDYLEKCMMTLKQKHEKAAQEKFLCCPLGSRDLARRLAVERKYCMNDKEIANTVARGLLDACNVVRGAGTKFLLLNDTVAAKIDTLSCEKLVKNARVVEPLEPQRAIRVVTSASNGAAHPGASGDLGYVFELKLSVDHRLHNKKSTALLVNCEGHGIDSEYIVEFMQPEGHVSVWSPHVHHDYGSHLSCEFVYWLEHLMSLAVLAASSIAVLLLRMYKQVISREQDMSTTFVFFTICWQLHIVLFWIHVKVYSNDGMGSPIVAFTSHMLAAVCDCGLCCVLLLMVCSNHPGPDLSVRILGVMAADLICLLREGESDSDRFLLVPWPMIKENDMRLSLLLIASRLLIAQRVIQSLLTSTSMDDIKSAGDRGVVGIVLLIWLGITPFCDWYATYAFPSGELLLAVLAVEGSLILILLWGLYLASSKGCEASAGAPGDGSFRTMLQRMPFGNRLSLTEAPPSSIRAEHPFGDFDNGFD
ncbi:hypothetical protein FOZ61_004037, partial [Perkinsus olseni]